jgi:S-adenosylmethionine:tRNA ribosyltransferase-isomerase
MMAIEDITYELPEDLIAVKPLPERSTSRLLMVSRKEKSIQEKVFSDIVDFIQEGDCLVFNDTKVFKARLQGTSESGRKIEVLLLERIAPCRWKTLLKNSSKIKHGEKADFHGIKAFILEKMEDVRIIEFEKPLDYEEINRIGEVPLPPYIVKKRKKMSLPDYSPEDDFRYQSVLAQNYGSVAAPTASFHFSEELIVFFKNKGVLLTTVTLHVGLGTFKPIDTSLDEFKMHSEAVFIPAENMAILKNVKRNGGRIIAVGTTVARALETSVLEKKNLEEWGGFSGESNLFIKDHFSFRIVDALITNFHMPKSTLLLLVYAFGGKELIQKSYRCAIEKKFRFLSYGDAMFIL